MYLPGNTSYNTSYEIPGEVLQQLFSNLKELILHLDAKTILLYRKREELPAGHMKETIVSQNKIRDFEKIELDVITGFQPRN